MNACGSDNLDGTSATLAMTELHTRAGKLSMQVQAQDAMLLQLRRENQALMTQLEPTSNTPPPPAPIVS